MPEINLLLTDGSGLCPCLSAADRLRRVAMAMIARTKNGNPVCLWNSDDLQPVLIGDRGRAGAKRADSNVAAVSFSLQRIQHGAEHIAGERRIHLEHRAISQFRCPRVLLDK